MFNLNLVTDISDHNIDSKEADILKGAFAFKQRCFKWDAT